MVIMMTMLMITAGAAETTCKNNNVTYNCNGSKQYQ